MFELTLGMTVYWGDYRGNYFDCKSGEVISWDAATVCVATLEERHNTMVILFLERKEVFQSREAAKTR